MAISEATMNTKPQNQSQHPAHLHIRWFLKLRGDKAFDFLSQLVLRIQVSSFVYRRLLLASAREGPWR